MEMCNNNCDFIKELFVAYYVLFLNEYFPFVLGRTSDVFEVA